VAPCLWGKGGKGARPKGEKKDRGNPFPEKGKGKEKKEGKSLPLKQDQRGKVNRKKASNRPSSFKPERGKKRREKKKKPDIRRLRFWTEQKRKGGSCKKGTIEVRITGGSPNGQREGKKGEETRWGGKKRRKRRKIVRKATSFSRGGRGKGGVDCPSTKGLPVVKGERTERGGGRGKKRRRSIIATPNF